MLNYDSSEKLYEGLKKGKEDAVQALIDKVKPKIHGLGRRYKLSAEDIESLIHDCVVEHYNKIRNDKYQLLPNVELWEFTIHVIAKDRVIDYYRKNKALATFDETLAESETESNVDAKAKSHRKRLISLNETHGVTDGMYSFETKNLLEQLYKTLFFLKPKLFKHLKLIEYDVQGYSDQEMVDKKLVPQKTAEAIRTQRKRLIEGVTAIFQDFDSFSFLTQNKFKNKDG